MIIGEVTFSPIAQFDSDHRRGTEKRQSNWGTFVLKITIGSVSFELLRFLENLLVLGVLAFSDIEIGQ